MAIRKFETVSVAHIVSTHRADVRRLRLPRLLRNGYFKGKTQQVRFFCKPTLTSLAEGRRPHGCCPSFHLCPQGWGGCPGRARHPTPPSCSSLPAERPSAATFTRLSFELMAMGNHVSNSDPGSRPQATLGSKSTAVTVVTTTIPRTNRPVGVLCTWPTQVCSQAQSPITQKRTPGPERDLPRATQMVSGPPKQRAGPTWP